ncbi:hypothetical protein OG216_35905 [Streptomycetaceae bacterium NBC_01309]
MAETVVTTDENAAENTDETWPRPPFGVECVRHHGSDTLDFEAINAANTERARVAAAVGPAWTAVVGRAVDGTDRALRRLAANLDLSGVDIHETATVLDLWVSSRGIHDLLHAATGARLLAQLSAEADIPLSVADPCPSRGRWTRNIHCHQPPTEPADAAPDRDATAAYTDALIEGRVQGENPHTAAGDRLIAALSHRANITCGALWADHPDGTVTLRCNAEAARQLIALGIPAVPQLPDRGLDVEFLLTDDQCHALTDKVIAHTAR